jgi:hypothetical protein
MWIQPSRSMGSRGRAMLVAIAIAAATMLAGARSVHAQAGGRGALGLSNPVESVDIVNGGLVATLVDGQQLPLGLTAQRVPGAPCPILDLSLGPIDLDLLGLVVQTSPICLEITAHPGGGLLGNLLCAVARLLDGGVSLADILASLNAQQQARLLDAIRDVLNAALNQLNNAAVTAVQQQQACTILDLALGPLELNVLGLVVELDDCSGGPVTVTITAVPGVGNLLGNLLCGLLGGITPGTTLAQLLQQVLAAIIGALG